MYLNPGSDLDRAGAHPRAAQEALRGSQTEGRTQPRAEQLEKVHLRPVRALPALLHTPPRPGALCNHSVGNQPV